MTRICAVFNGTVIPVCFRTAEGVRVVNPRKDSGASIDDPVIQVLFSCKFSVFVY